MALHEWTLQDEHGAPFGVGMRAYGPHGPFAVTSAIMTPDGWSLFAKTEDGLRVVDSGGPADQVVVDELTARNLGYI